MLPEECEDVIKDIQPRIIELIMKYDSFGKEQYASSTFWVVRHSDRCVDSPGTEKGGKIFEYLMKF